MARRALADIERNDDTRDDSDYAESSTARKVKRAKTSRAVSKATTGTRTRRKLSALLELPLDVVYEIFSHLHPSHLLNVSRTNKALRAMLMCRNARSVWKASFGNYPDIPPVPDDLNEPQYARLLFDKSCMECLAPNVSTVAWGARWRCCKKCFEYDFWPEDKIYGLVELEPYDRDLKDVVPGSLLKDKSGEMTMFYKIKQVLAFLHEAKNYWGDPEKAKVWVEEKVAESKKQEDHGFLLQDWDSMRQEARARELDEIRHQRQEAVFERLRALGWGEEVEKSRLQLIENSNVSKAQPLTDYGWSKIKDNVVNHIASLREVRLMNEKSRRYKAFSDAYDAFLLAQPPGSVFPPVGSLVDLDHVRCAIYDTPVEDDLSDEVIRALVDAIPTSWFDTWRANAEKQLRDKMVEKLGDKAPSNLALASVVFTYTPAWATDASQVRLVRYPEVLMDPTITDEFDRKASETRKRTGYMPWSAAGIDFSEAIHERARFFVELAGLDPEMATHEDMALADPWYSYHTPDGAVSYLSGWPHVLRDGMQCAHFNGVAEDMAATFRFAVNSLLWMPRFDEHLARCTRCGASFRKSSALYAHLLDE
ncbi:hypothetical protein K525DRAFT_290413 [Schizophyllum commune Loenen D]|nr:hypothetical protein K525DRAFT_290413 [Schizophyllum commune Loenen D]